MKEFKNIDRLFQEKFRDFEIEPTGKVWDNIESTINKKQEKDKPVFWWWFSGIAAGLALLLYLNTSYFNNQSTEINTTDVTENKDNQTLNNNHTPTINTNNSLVVHQEDTDTKEQTKTTPSPTLKHSKKVIHKQVADKQKLITKIPAVSNPPIKKEQITTKKQQVITLAQTDKKVIPAKKAESKVKPEETLADNSQTKIIEKQPNKDKWSVSTFAAPVYLSAFDKNTSSIDAQFKQNTKQGSFSSAYGVQVAYQVNNKFSLQSGVHLVDYGYKTYDVYVSPSGAVNHYANIKYTETANLINIYALPAVQNSIDQTNIQETKGDILQVFGYVEIPLEVKYQINKRNGFGINIVGGFSTLLLNKNQIFIETEGLSSRLGEASNLNSLNFSGNVGLEFNYKLFKNFDFNMVPMFKVQTQTFKKNTEGFSPYAIGIYSGLNYRF